MDLEKKYIGVDFDGTIVTHNYPEIGEPVPHALRVLRKLRIKGHRLILVTMRSDHELEEAVKYLNSSGIRLYGKNHNPDQKSWTNSPKPFANLYIDDAALGCPTVYDQEFSDRPYVDWKRVEKILQNRGLL